MDTRVFMNVKTVLRQARVFSYVLLKKMGWVYYTQGFEEIEVTKFHLCRWKNSRDPLYNMVTVVNNIAFYIWELPWE